MSEPREWWILTEKFHVIDTPMWKEKPKGIPDCNLMQVIEKSAYDAIAKELAEAKEIISHLPKVPTQPYEKEMAREIVRLRQALKMIEENPSGDSWNAYGTNENNWTRWARNYARKALEGK